LLGTPCKLNEKGATLHGRLISFSSFALPEALLFVTKPKPVKPALLSHFKLLEASFVPRERRDRAGSPGTPKTLLGAQRSSHQTLGTRTTLEWNAERRSYHSSLVDDVPGAHGVHGAPGVRNRDWNRPRLNRIESSAPNASDRFLLETVLRTGPSTRTLPPFRSNAPEKPGKISST
jgi:hypothetical protein